MGFGDYLNIYNAIKQMPKKFKNIFMWNALILVLVEMPKFKFVCALMVILSLGRRLMKTVFLHGLGQTAQDWKEVVQQLSISDVDCPELFSSTEDEISYFADFGRFRTAVFRSKRAASYLRSFVRCASCD